MHRMQQHRCGTWIESKREVNESMSKKYIYYFSEGNDAFGGDKTTMKKRGKRRLWRR